MSSALMQRYEDKHTCEKFDASQSLSIINEFVVENELFRSMTLESDQRYKLPYLQHIQLYINILQKRNMVTQTQQVNLMQANKILSSNPIPFRTR